MIPTTGPLQMKIAIAALFLLGAVTAIDEDEIEAVMNKRGLPKAVPIKNIKGSFFAAHNAARAQHVNTNPLQYDDGLARQAEAYALELANQDKFQHSSGDTRPGQGENLFTGISDTFNTQTVNLCMTKWYEEGARFDYALSKLYNFRGIKSLGHFTAIVWQDTTKVGCGGAYINRGWGRVTMFVCRYTPGGNQPGGYHTKVHKLKPGKVFPGPEATAFFSLCSDDPGFATYCKDTIGPKADQYCAASSYGKYLKGKCDKTCGYC